MRSNTATRRIRTRNKRNFLLIIIIVIMYRYYNNAYARPHDFFSRVILSDFFLFIFLLLVLLLLFLHASRITVFFFFLYLVKLPAVAPTLACARKSDFWAHRSDRLVENHPNGRRYLPTAQKRFLKLCRRYIIIRLLRRCNARSCSHCAIDAH